MNNPNAVGIFIAPITTKIDMPAPLFELLCCLLDIGSSAALVGGLNSAMTPSTKLSTPQQRRANQLRTCATANCNALSFRNTDYCWKHQDEPPSDPDIDQVVDELVPEPEPESEANWWEEQTEIE